MHCTRTKTAAVVAILALALSACATGSEDADPVADEPQQDAATPDAPVDDGTQEADDGTQEDVLEVSISVSGSSLMSAVPIVLADDQGYFEDEGIALGEIISSDGGATSIRNMLDGDLTMTEVAVPAAIEAYLAGAPVQMVGSSHQGAYDFVFASLPDAGIDDVADMEGRTWGFTNPGSASEDLSYLIPDAAGVDPDSIERVPTGGLGGGIAMLEGGEVDLALVIPSIIRANPGRFEEAVYALDYLPAYQKTVFVVDPAFAEANPEVVSGMMAAIHRGFEFLREEPEEAAVIFAATNEDFDEADMVEEFELANSRGVAEGGVGFNAEGLAAVARGLELSRGITDIPWSEIADPSYLPDGAATELPPDPEGD